MLHQFLHTLYLCCLTPFSLISLISLISLLFPYYYFPSSFDIFPVSPSPCFTDKSHRPDSQLYCTVSFVQCLVPFLTDLYNFLLPSSTITLVQYSTVQYSTVQYNTVQYSTVQYSTVQYSTVQYSTVQYSTVDLDTMHQLHHQTMSMVLLHLAGHCEHKILKCALNFFLPN